jgi:hypothetical protein
MISRRLPARGHSGTLAEASDPILRLWRIHWNSWRQCRRTVDACSRRSWGTRRLEVGSCGRVKQAPSCSGSTQASTSRNTALSASRATSECGQSVPLLVSHWGGSSQRIMCERSEALTVVSGATSSSLLMLSLLRERLSLAFTRGVGRLGFVRSSLRIGSWTAPESCPRVARSPSIPGYYWAPARNLGRAALSSTPGATPPQSSTHTDNLGSRSSTAQPDGNSSSTEARPQLKVHE